MGFFASDTCPIICGVRAIRRFDVYCDDHRAHEEHFERLDARVGDLEADSKTIMQLVARMDAVVTQLQHFCWVIVTACAGAVATALFAVITR